MILEQQTSNMGMVYRLKHGDSHPNKSKLNAISKSNAKAKRRAARKSR